MEYSAWVHSLAEGNAMCVWGMPINTCHSNVERGPSLMAECHTNSGIYLYIHESGDGRLMGAACKLYSLICPTGGELSQISCNG